MVINGITLSGDGAANVLNGGAGDDTLSGGLGLDTLDYALEERAQGGTLGVLVNFWGTFVLVPFSSKALQCAHSTDLLASSPRVSGDFLGRGMTGDRHDFVL